MKSILDKTLSPSYSFPKVFYKIILINLILDILAYWSDPGGITAVFRTMILYSTLFYFVIIQKISIRLNFPIVLFSLYVILQLFVAKDLSYSIKVSFQIITSLWFFFVGFALIKNDSDFRYYLHQFFLVYILIILNTLFSNVFDVGIDNYTSDSSYVVGGLSDLWNVYTYSLILFPLLLKFEIANKQLLFLTGFLVFVLLIMSLKRIAIAGVIFSALMYIFFLGARLKMVKHLFLFLFAAVLLSPFYLNILEHRIEARAEKGRFEENFYETEARYMEMVMMNEWVSEFRNPEDVLFGLKAFDTRGALNGGQRQFHIDYTLILYSIGIIGLILYLMIYWRFFALIKGLNRKLKRNPVLSRGLKIVIVAAYVLLIISLVTSVAGQMYHLTFRLMIFMTLGTILKFLRLKLSSKSLNY